MNTPNALPQFIPLAKLTASPLNHREYFDKAKMAELTESVRIQGVIQPIIARPLNGAGGKFEIVAGERRYRAAKAAGLVDIPAMVREVTDAQALELQVIENGQRVDVHPLEEASGYEALMKCPQADGHKLTVDEIAAKIGKSRSYIFGRLKLLDLCPEARKASYEGLITASVALLIARIPVADLQKIAVKEVAREGHHFAGAMSYKEASEHIQRKYMLNLSAAPFPIKDASLVPKAGACTACPKRTGNQVDLFEDVKSDMMCTDPGCFERKVAAARSVRVAEAEASGQTVIAGKDAKKLKPQHYSPLGGGYLDLSKHEYVDGKSQTIKQILGKNLPPVTLIEDPHDGGFIEAVMAKDVKGLLASRMQSSRARVTNAKSPQQAAKEKNQRAREKLEAEIRREIYVAAREKASAGLGDEDVRVIVANYWERHWHDWKKMIAPWWIADEPEGKKKRGAHDRIDALTKRIPTMTGTELVKLLLDCALVSGVADSRDSYLGKSDFKDVEALAKRHGVDAAAIRRKLTAAAQDKVAPKSKAKAKTPGPTAQLK